MAPATDTVWSTDFDTVRREKLFRNPPKDHSAYPALAAAVKPHIESFNALFEGKRLLDLGLQDIGTKSFLDYDFETEEQRSERVAAKRPPRPQNRLSVRMTEIFLDKAVLPPNNKFSTKNRNILPSECRERHATYRGRLRARLQWRVNNEEWAETVRDLGALPIMVKVCQVRLHNYGPN
jgi:DNA-directed RNA polymerase I subunit RPA2